MDWVVRLNHHCNSDFDKKLRVQSTFLIIIKTIVVVIIIVCVFISGFYSGKYNIAIKNSDYIQNEWIAGITLDEMKIYEVEASAYYTNIDRDGRNAESMYEFLDK